MHSPLSEAVWTAGCGSRDPREGSACACQPTGALAWRRTGQDAETAVTQRRRRCPCFDSSKLSPASRQPRGHVSSPSTLKYNKIAKTYPATLCAAQRCAVLTGHRVVGSMKVFTLVVALAALACSATGADVGATSQHNGLGPFSRLYRPRSMPSPCTTVQGSCGESLHLSRLPPAVARKASRVEGIGSFPSYAGFFTVREDTDNNLFFWYAMCSAMCNVQVCRCRCRCRCSCSPSEAAAPGTL